ncbi:MAG: hypothetical protein NWS96_07655, partial [Pseudomonadales bacterium]|nr:hypothetical protein [Pseudomonadales bacterium]
DSDNRTATTGQRQQDSTTGQHNGTAQRDSTTGQRQQNYRGARAMNLFLTGMDMFETVTEEQSQGAS